MTSNITVTPFFISSEEDLESMIEWKKCDAVIRGVDGKIIFEQKGVEFPQTWSDTAISITADKYFRVGNDGTRENSLKQLVKRVVNSITEHGLTAGYFDENSAYAFSLDLSWLIYNQYYSFNSPVYFNVGVDEHPQVSACFIQSVDDDMNSILQLNANEGRIFKNGSGTGTNFSRLRGRDERLSGGGLASGPVSFMKGLDASAGVIKSGGKTRRAAKMAILDIVHPDIRVFTKCKVVEEEKARALKAAGYSDSFDDDNGAYSSVAFQNENHSVRVNASFMRAVEEDAEWDLYYTKTGALKESVKARELLRDIAEAIHYCGDPGIMYSDNINKYNTVPASGEIRASNPCGEYLDIDDSACNLGSFNLIRFVDIVNGQWTFDSETFRKAIRIATIAQEILVDMASYPTEKIAVNSQRHRQLGLGYANLGALLMYCGYPYDSSEGRALAECISSLLTGTAYATSADMARVMGPFDAYKDNKDAMLAVMALHRDSTQKIGSSFAKQNKFVQQIEDMRKVCMAVWKKATVLGKKYGFRNAKATVLAPTGTIGFFMGCDTTGVEPELSLVKKKSMVGGGEFNIVNNSVLDALENLGYNDADRQTIAEHIDQHGTVDGCAKLSSSHVSIFDCAFGSGGSDARIIAPMGHVKMLEAVQPHISGGISKTINLPESTTVEEINRLLINAWKMGVKAMTIYRDKSKVSQPLRTAKQQAVTAMPEIGKKRKMPSERDSKTHNFSIAGHKFFLTTGLYPEGTPGEIFITASKSGSTLRGLFDCFGISVSLGLQHGVPLESYVEKLAHVRFEPSGFTDNPNLKLVKSIPDYIFRYLAMKFAADMDVGEGMVLDGDSMDTIASTDDMASDAPPCLRCGQIMVRSGTCFKCTGCGDTSGCS